MNDYFAATRFSRKTSYADIKYIIRLDEEIAVEIKNN